MTTTGPGFSFQVFGSKGWLRLEGVTHVAGASSEERRTRLFGTCKFQPVKGEAKVWQAASARRLRAPRSRLSPRRPRAARPSRSPGSDDPRRRRDRGHHPLGGLRQVQVRDAVSLRAGPRTESLVQTHPERLGHGSRTLGTTAHGSRQRPRPPDLFDARASRRQLGADVAIRSTTYVPKVKARVVAQPVVRRVAAAVGASAETLVE